MRRLAIAFALLALAPASPPPTYSALKQEAERFYAEKSFARAHERYEQAQPNQRARAVGRVMLGLTVATLLGVPLATSFGQTLGWRAAFAAVGAIGSLAILLIWRFIPAISADVDASPLRELGALRRLQVWLTLGIGAVGYAVQKYVRPAGEDPADGPLLGRLVAAASGA